LPFKCNLQRYSAGVSPETIRLVGKVEEGVESPGDIAAPPKRCGVVGLYKLNAVVTHSLKAPGDPTLLPIK
jgi:hypothetical protein